MTADLSASAAKLAAAARPREELLAALAAEPKPFTGRWRVVRQFTHLPDVICCSHRFELTAELCARWRTRRQPADLGIHYDARRADS